MKKSKRFSTGVISISKYLVLSLFAITFSQACIYGQETRLIYDIEQSGKVIGEIIFIEAKKEHKTNLSFISNVKTNFVFSFTDHAEEFAEFEDGIMVYSTFYRKQNGSCKAKKSTRAAGICYELVNDGVPQLINCKPIRYNMLMLYTSIPETTSKVYSDNFQKLLDIKKVDQNKYKLTLPDGNYNYYLYKNGLCSEVVIERTFFTLRFVLRENKITKLSNN